MPTTHVHSHLRSLAFAQRTVDPLMEMRMVDRTAAEIDAQEDLRSSKIMVAHVLMGTHMKRLTRTWDHASPPFAEAIVHLRHRNTVSQNMI